MSKLIYAGFQKHFRAVVGLVAWLLLTDFALKRRRLPVRPVISPKPTKKDEHLHICHHAFSDSMSRLRPYYCEGAAYDNFTDAMLSYALSAKSPTWGNRDFPLPAGVTVFMIGNSHTAQVASTIHCQYESKLEWSKEHVDRNGRYAYPMNTWRFQNNATLVVLTNTLYVYHKDNWAANLASELGVNLSSYDAIVMGEFNGGGGNTIARSAFGLELKNFSIFHPEFMDAKFTRPTIERLADTYQGPIVAVPMFSLGIQDVKHNGEKTQHRWRESANRTNIKVIHARKHIEALGYECGSDFKFGIGLCFNAGDEVKHGRRPVDMHRCIGLKGGHTDLVAWDIIEVLYELLA